MARRPRSKRSKNKVGTWRRKRTAAGNRSTLSGAGRRTSSRAPEINEGFRTKGRFFTDSVHITRSDRDVH